MNLKICTVALVIALSTAVSPSGGASAQEAVVAAKDNDALFTSKDPVLNANKQVVYHIMKDLLEAGRWGEAGTYLSARYIQHNPNVPSGRESVVTFFTKILKVEAKPVPEKLATPVVFVNAEGDLVTVATVRTVKDPKEPAKTYTTTWYDTWRILDGKADEHWDSAVKP